MDKSKIKLKRKIEWFLIFMIIYIMFTLSRSIVKFFEVSKKLGEARGSLEESREDLKKIEAKIKQATSEAYIERVARNRLNMQKKGEVVVVLPKDDLEFLEFGLNKEKDKEKEKPNWKKWWDLIK